MKKKLILNYNIEATLVYYVVLKVVQHLDWLYYRSGKENTQCHFLKMIITSYMQELAEDDFEIINGCN